MLYEIYVSVFTKLRIIDTYEIRCFVVKDTLESYPYENTDLETAMALKRDKIQNRMFCHFVIQIYRQP